MKSQVAPPQVIEVVSEVVSKSASEVMSGAKSKVAGIVLSEFRGIMAPEVFACVRGKVEDEITDFVKGIKSRFAKADRNRYIFHHGKSEFVCSTPEELYVLMRKKLNPKYSFSIAINGKLLRQNCSFEDYGLRMLVVYRLEVTLHLLKAGSLPQSMDIDIHKTLQKYSHQSVEELITLIDERQNTIAKTFVVQAGSLSQVESALTLLKSLMGNNIPPFISKLIEDIVLLIIQLVRSRSKGDVLLSLLVFTKLRVEGPILSAEMFEKLVVKFGNLFSEFQVQSDEDDVTFTQRCFKEARWVLDQYDLVKDCKAVRKLRKLCLYILSLGLFEKLGITFKTFNYTRVEESILRKKYKPGVDFVYTLFDAAMFLCENGYQCMISGSLDPILHGSSAYQKWMEMATRLRVQSKFMSNPEPHGFDRHNFLCELRDCIDKGKSIVKYANDMDPVDKRLCSGMLNEMQLILANEITLRSAQKARKAPFVVLLHGASSIGKSTLENMLMFQYGKCFNKPIDSEYKYTRNYLDQYWPGYNSTQWFLVLDDMAWMRPSIATNGDLSVMELIMIANNVPYVPTQADLPDKGKTPLLVDAVVGTTNKKDLNAYHYFQTPFAAQRRLPFVIDVAVKKEFARFECMLDSSKTMPIDGEWPNYWNFVVSRVVPASTTEFDHQGKYEVLHEFDHIDDLLAWYATEANNHREIQEKVMNSLNEMKALDVCTKCYKLTTKCECLEVQADDDEIILYEDFHRVLGVTQERLPAPENADFGEMTWLNYMKCVMFGVFMRLYVSDLSLWFTRKAIYNTIFYQWLQKTVIGIDTDLNFLLYCSGRAGRAVENRFPRMREALSYAKIFSIVIGIGAVWKLHKVFFSKPNIEVNGSNISKDIGRAPEPRSDEKQNVWYKEYHSVSEFDVQPKSTSWASLENTAVISKVSTNCIKLGVHLDTGIRRICAFGLGGHVYVTNNHAFPKNQTYTVELTRGLKDQGVNSNMVIKISACDMCRFPDRDLVFFRIRNLPPVKDISGLLPKQSIRGTFEGTLIARDRDGLVQTKQVANIRKEFIAFCDAELGFNHNNQAWVGIPSSQCVVGDCGSVLLSKGGIGPIIMGIHFGTYDGKCCANFITIDDYNVALKKFGFVVQCGEPKLNTSTIVNNVGKLHFKSPIRYIEQGVANVYGSFDNAQRSGGTSKVAKTFIADHLISTGEYKIEFGAPVMKGWEPWRHALVEMVNPVVEIDNQILDACMEEYYNDVVSNLPEAELREIFVYDNFTAVNGAAGVAYVDSINRKSSMGFPWRKSKKHFLHAVPARDGLNEPVDFDAEIWERVDGIISGYEEGVRAMPVFTGSLKDEALKFSKIESKKTRVFAGAPIDWSLVVRKYLLGFVRVMQRNKFVFEAAPGTNAMSKEWTDIFRYVTKFGEDRIIAGDYGAYDKVMSPGIILAAYRVIYKICEKAGYSEKELRVLQGIAEDTAFPLMNMNGDLIEFYGSNPSGHPLTVIINCIAGSLYMRYCYAVLNPDGVSCKNFKKHVKLMTYGDDNIMGVSKDISWFNHTSIMNALASVNITYTMADKEAESIPFINIEEASFLKRSWRYDEESKLYMCPLEEKSISKMLTIGVATKEPPKKQALEIITAAISEYFFYGREKFENRRQFLISVAEKCKLLDYETENSFPSWEMLMRRFTS